MDTTPRGHTAAPEQASPRTQPQPPRTQPQPPPPAAPQTVRLAFLWRAAGAPLGCLLALAMGIALARTGVAGRLGAVPALLLSGTAVLGIALPVPYGFWLRADAQGLTLVRAFLPRRYRWQDIAGLTMETDEDPDSGAARLVLLLRLVPAATPVRTERRDRVHGPVIGALGTTADGLPRGTEPRHLAELFDLLRRHGIPLEDRRYADLVLTAHGYPALAHTAGPTAGPTAPRSPSV
ncbi:hypothetical protein [Streptomyces sp. CBMA123]|uniref:hypothetical protein n=1 Tax=Streptomyces sp. CBMA123 TaxID=1896313 RepID=UPI001661E18A|nr:hypothetical protein [Streptomyces sp. CBMA123]MBD0693618.1 hypothetical protein [Streptomyces sp. CBMA123]